MVGADSVATMSTPILVAVAWPYASGSRHVGHLAGAYLPADVFARYHRLAGNDVLMVSGSDVHGTPITVRADDEGVTPQEIVDRYHAEFVAQWEALGISWDLFTSTGTANHAEVTQDIFLRLLEQGFIDRRASEEFYDPDRSPTNVELVAEAVALCEDVGRPVATTAETVEILRLPR